MKFLRILLEELKGQKAKRGEFLVKTFQPKWQGLDQFDKIEDFVEYVGTKVDPTDKGIYMQWIVNRVIKNPQENRPEDLPRLAKDLLKFEEVKPKLEKKDINQYKNFHEVYVAIEPFTKRRTKTAEEKRAAKLDKVRADVIDVYSGPEGWIKIPTTKQASCYLGQNTRWCTAARSSNMFDSYNKQDSLFVIYDKKSRARFQLHITAGQLADVTDKTQPMSDLPVWARKPIISWYKKNNPQLNMKQIMTFAGFGDTESAKGTEHEGLVDLMKQYGIM